MGSVVIDMSMSLDGYIAAPNEGVRDGQCASAHGVVVSTIHGDLLW